MLASPEITVSFGLGRFRRRFPGLAAGVTRLAGEIRQHLGHRVAEAVSGVEVGQLDFAKYDLFLSKQIAHFLDRMSRYQDRDGSTLDNTIVMFGRARMMAMSSTAVCVGPSGA